MLSSVQHVAEVAVIGIKVSTVTFKPSTHISIPIHYEQRQHTHMCTHSTLISQDAYRGQVPLGLLVLNEPTPEHPTIDSGAVIQHAIDAVRHKIGAFCRVQKSGYCRKIA